MVLKYDAYNETLEKQHEKEFEVQRLQEKYDKDIALLKEEMRSMRQLLNSIATRKLSSTQFYIVQ